MAEIDLADRLLKVIAAHDIRPVRLSSARLGCGCGWATADTPDAVDRWRKHRNRAVRAAIDELIGVPTTTGDTQP